MLLSEIAGSVMQIFLFALIPFIWWFAAARKRVGFFRWIGLSVSIRKNFRKNLIWIICTIIGFGIVGVSTLYMLGDTPTAASEFVGLGARALPAILIYALFHTALSEELFFRGFLLKTLAAQWGFQAGNTIQAVLFGLLHGMMFISAIGAVKAILIVMFTGAIAWIMGYINERKFDGSILPSWMIHGASNVISSLLTVFLM